MNRAPKKTRLSLAEITFRRTLKNAYEHLAVRIEKMDENQLAALRRWLDEPKQDRPKTHTCENTESILPFSVLCTTCSVFKKHHLWPCPNFQMEPFLWIQPSGEGDLALSENQEAYYQENYVKTFEFHYLETLEKRAFFEPEVFKPKVTK